MLNMKPLTAFVAMIIALAVVAPAAFAQTKVIVIDQAQIERDSQAGQSLRNALATINTQMQSEVAPGEQAYQAQEAAFQGKVANMTQEAMQADPGIQTEFRALQTKAAEVSQAREVRAAEMRMTQRKAAQAYAEALRPVVLEVMAEENAQVVLDKASVLMSDDAIDVTTKIISKLDAATPTISVTRERLPQQPAANAGQ
ncbi:MAG: OmpH family outer membrane protein [Pseudomonadota bacterium]